MILADRYSEKELKLLDYVTTHPGANKEQVIKELTQQNVLTRVPIVKKIKMFVDDGVIKAVKEKPNSRSYQLFINESDKASTLFQELRNFSRSYFILLDEVQRIWDEQCPDIKAEDYVSMNKKVRKELELANELNSVVQKTIGIFFIVLECYLHISISEWPKQIQDKDELRKLYSNAYGQIAEMHLTLLSKANSNHIAGGGWDVLNSHIYYKWLQKHDLSDHFERMVASIKSWSLEQELFGTMGWSIEDVKKGNLFYHDSDGKMKRLIVED